MTSSGFVKVFKSFILSNVFTDACKEGDNVATERTMIKVSLKNFI